MKRTLSLLLAGVLLLTLFAAVVPTTSTAQEVTPTATERVVVVTATLTPTPSATPLPQPTPDVSEPNNALNQATTLEIGGKLQKLNFWPAGDVDYFSVLVKSSQVGMLLSVETRADYGLDTKIRLLWPDGQLIAENDDASPTEKRSVLLHTLAGEGYYIIEATNLSITDPSFKNYDLVTAIVDPATITPGATPTPNPLEQRGHDPFENNYDFDHAAQVPVGEDVKGLNFVCPVGAPATCGDNDFFAIQLKGGQCYSAETANVDPALDTNLIVYGAARDLAPPLAGNDDRGPGDTSSYTTFCVAASEAATVGYILIGNAGNMLPPPPAAERTYTLRVQLFVPPTPTPLPTSTPMPTTTPVPQASPPPVRDEPPPANGGGSTNQQAIEQPSIRIEPPTPGPRQLAGVIVEELGRQEEALPTPKPLVVVPLSIRACYDRNENKFCDVDEGIGGLTVYFTNSRGRVLGQALTDSTGVAALTVRVEETEQLGVSIPYFAAKQTVAARSPLMKDVLVPAALPLPALLP